MKMIRKLELEIDFFLKQIRLWPYRCLSALIRFIITLLELVKDTKKARTSNIEGKIN